MRSIMAAAFAALTGLAVASAPAVAAFPEKPIRLIIPFQAGGGSDGLARAVQAAVEKYALLPVPLVVVNVDGAAGTVGTRRVLDAEPDGYTILQIHQEMFSASALGRVEYTPSDLDPIIQASESCLFVAVPKESEFQTLEDLLDYARANPGRLKQADDIGSVTHFPSAQLMKLAGTTWVIVPTGGTSKRFASLKGGFTDSALLSAPWLERGKNDLRALAALGPERFEVAPELPTAKELGYDVEACLIRRYWAPKGTPEDRIAVIADAIEAALATEEVQSYLASSGEAVSILRDDALAQRVTEDYQDFVDVVDVVKQTSGQ